jgi:stage II sporulation protein D
MAPRFRFALTAIAFVVLATAGVADASWTVRGRGSGHGVGMSQYGAYGYAKHGREYRWIVGHYFRNTRIGHVSNPTVKVLLSSGTHSVGFTGADRACGRDLDAHTDYDFARSGGGVVLRRDSGKRLKDCGGTGSASGGATVKVRELGAYRGKLVARSSSGGLLAINAVGLEDYARGVVANEESSSWPQAALRAQAVAVRSYALATSGGGSFDVYDDTRSQVYGGKGSETGPTDKAVRKTRGEVVRHHHAVATTYYFSSSGGRTENVEFGFPGSDPEPWLKSVADRFDGVSPDHKWKRHFTNSEMDSHLSGLFSGNLRRIDVTKRGVSPRIVEARVVGSKGSSRVSGPTLQYRLGLGSTWARFDKR